MTRTNTKNGRKMCVAGTCSREQHMPVCRCNRKRLCKKKRASGEFWTRDGARHGGREVYCKKITLVVTKAEFILPHQADHSPSLVKTVEQRSIKQLETFNHTHCICSKKRAVHTSLEGKCLTFMRMNYGFALFCKLRDCNVTSEEFACDAMGTSYCTRLLTVTSGWINDGPTTGHANQVYCHRGNKMSETTSVLFHL